MVGSVSLPACPSKRRATELLARWPAVQSATLPAALPEPEREALLRQRLDVAPLATGYSGLRHRYGTTLWVLLGLTASSWRSRASTLPASRWRGR